ncbi:MAG: pitrilysin family protein [Gemmatimonadota bacterium]
MSDRCERTDLDGGPVVLSETVPGVRSVSFGVWVRSGSVDERIEEMGVSHLLEHMVFKGTTHRTARDIAVCLERLGGTLDAYTTREHTSYQARVLDEHADLGLDVLADLALNPLLREEDLELEREVVLEEISTVDDTPDDLIFEISARQLWDEHPYGYSVLGTRESVTAMTTARLRAAHERAYRRGSIVVAAAGHLDHAWLADRVAERFGTARPGGGVRNGLPEPGPFRPGRRVIPRPGAQTHLVLATRTFGHSDARRYAMILLSTVLGGGMSSRLFQRVREELGLAYSVFSFQSFYRLAGIAGVYVGTRPEWAERAEAVVLEEYERVARGGLTAAELADAKGQLKGQLVLSLESAGTRLHRLAGTALYGEPFRAAEQVMAEVDAVTGSEVAALAAEYYRPGRQCVTCLGPE